MNSTKISYIDETSSLGWFDIPETTENEVALPPQAF
jgi:hypothetical protein